MKKIQIGTWLIGVLFSACTQQPSTSFQLLSPEESGVQFANTITENDTLNILVKEFVYNGGGVAVGDLNGDGLEDIFFSGSQVDNALYLNKGNLKFEDITASAGVKKPNVLFWSSGINILDLNLDGKLDIYVCNTLHPNPEFRRNFLYINQGNDTNQIPIFREMAKAYRIDDPSHSAHAQFFDYDKDGDLDLFVGVNWIEREYPNQFVDLNTDGTAPNRDLLLQNNWNDSLGHPVFTDVSLSAGLVHDGYSHSSLIVDFNEDGWQDIYVANDYQSNDLVYINNQNGTFTNQAGKIFKHFSLSAMGSDVADINNDGAADFFTSEMQPYYNKRKKLFQGGSSYQSQVLTEQFKYEYQYPRNTLQLQLGKHPETGLPIFGDVGMYAKVQETDWSWSTLFADYDNDGWKDLYVANGFPRDVTDRDFSDFRVVASKLVSLQELVAAIPAVKSPNFLFKNRGDLTFENMTSVWGLQYPSFSNGAAYADLDNDGDLDLITNNINDPAFIFENRTNPLQKKSTDHNFLRIKLQGAPKNPDAIGAFATLYHEGQLQKSYLLSGRGYLSKSENTLHFGLGRINKIDSLIITWADGQETFFEQIAANQVLEIVYQTAAKRNRKLIPTSEPLFRKSAAEGLLHKDEELDFADFNFQRTLPHKFSQYGPSIAVADVTGDGLEDIFLGGSATFMETWFVQQTNGTFVARKINYKSHPQLWQEDAGSLLFDADSDGDNDLYIARGGGQFIAGDSLYQDVLLLNDGKGNFRFTPNALPKLLANASCVKAADFDGDDDLDLFVGSRVLPFAFPYSDKSYLLRNDSNNGQVRFTDVTATVCPELQEPGMVSDALWTDFNNDHLPDLLLACEWMPLKIFENQAGKLKEITATSGLENYLGWWNSLAAADFDQDGDIDYVAGNFGENLYYQCTSEQPIRVYGKDWDKNGMIDPLISCYWQDSLGKRSEYLYHPREDLIKQLSVIRKKYNTHGQYGEATVQDMFSKEDLADALTLWTNWMKTAVIENLGQGKFILRALPKEAQLAPIYGILPYDADGNGTLDVLLVGNDFGMEVQQGRADAFSGLVLLNRGGFSFEPLSLAKSHFTVLGDARGLVNVATTNQSLLIAVQNHDSLRVFEHSVKIALPHIPLKNNEVKARYFFRDGQQRIEEFYWGSGFLSQKGRHIIKPSEVEKIELLDRKGIVQRTL